jgi:tripartite ATP-independent transporter DctM subunit
MSNIALVSPENCSAARTSNVVVSAENALLVLLFVLSAMLPFAEIILRAVFHVGIVGVGSIVQHLILAVGMLGASVAARENRLLSLSASSYIQGRHKALACTINRVVASAITALLMLTAIDFTLAERQSGMVLVYGLPVWVAELPLALGYGLIAMRLLRQSASSTVSRLYAAIFVAGLVTTVKFFTADFSQIMVPALMATLVATLLGAPIFVAIGGAALFLMLAHGMPAASVAVDHYSLVMNASLPAIPMFILAGYLLAESGAPKRLIEVFDSILGRLPGGAAIVTVFACTFFTSFTGASGVTVLTLGGLVMPLLISAGYKQRAALGLVTAAGLPGTLLMPALPLILYGIVAGVSIEDMFLGGLLPTLMMAGIIVIWGFRHQPALPNAGAAFSWTRIYRATRNAGWELTVPFVPLLALTSGLATPVESASLTATYVLFISGLIRRDISISRDIPRIIVESGIVVGGVLLIMGVALGFTDFLVNAQIPDLVVDWVRSHISSQIGFLLALNVFLLIAGCVVEIYPAIMVLAPIVTHAGQAYGINPVHLGMIFLANMELGYLTPLVGLNLFFASYRFEKTIVEIFRAVAPLFVALALGVLVITYVPWLSTALLRFRS